MQWVWNREDFKKVFEIDVNFKGNNVRINSLAIEKGDIFIALDNGETHDGHKYIDHAFLQGASCCIINTSSKVIYSNQYNSSVIRVKDTHIALKNMVEYKIKTLSHVKKIAITGSSGKSTVKHILGFLLKAVCCSPDLAFIGYKNFNNKLGLYLNIASIPSCVKYAVFEIGTNSIGEIKELTSIIRPDVSVITIIGDAHIGNFLDSDAIAKEKSDIMHYMVREKIVILNRDGNYFKFLSDIAKKNGVSIYSFGANDASNLIFLDSDHGHNKIQIDGNELSFNTNLLGKHNIYNILCSLSCIKVLNLDYKKAINSIHRLSALDGRGKEFSVKEKNSTIFDFSYNANPTSVRSNLSYFDSYKNDKRAKILVLGDMMELGVKEREYHMNLLDCIVDAGIDRVITLGNVSKSLYAILPHNMKLFHARNVENVIDKLDLAYVRDSIFMIQGANSMNMNKLVKYLTQDLSY